MSTKPSKELETFPNPAEAKNYEIFFDCPEFTCLCPKTGQPDFAHIKITYVPDELCVELKSLKLYLWSYRDEAPLTESQDHRGVGARLGSYPQLLQAPLGSVQCAVSQALSGTQKARVPSTCVGLRIRPAHLHRPCLVGCEGFVVLVLGAKRECCC